MSFDKLVLDVESHDPSQTDTILICNRVFGQTEFFGKRLLKRLHLFFLSNVPGATFFKGSASILDFRADLIY